MIGFQTGPSFIEQGSYTLPSQPNGIAGADFNHDGNLDLAVTVPGEASVRVMLGTGASGQAGFAAPEIAGFVGLPTCMAAADVTGDGAPDLIVGTGALSVVVLPRTSGGFGPGVAFPLPSNCRALSIADFNLDGRPDIAATTMTGFSILLATGIEGSGGLTTTSYAVANIIGLAVGDLNGDGRPDIVVTRATASSGSVSSYLCGPGGSVTLYATTTTSAPLTPPVLADFNGDGRLDCVFGLNLAIPYLLQLMQGDGAGGFPGGDSTATTLLGTALPSLIVAADFSTDGRPDLIGAGRMRVNAGGGAFFEPFTNFSTEIQAAVADFAAPLDGRPDIAAIQSNSNVVRWRRTSGGESPVITQNPTNARVAPGQSASFSIAVSAPGVSTGVLYQWRRNGVPLNDSPTVQGSKSATLSLSGLTIADSGAVFDCLVTSPRGTLTSTAASLVVQPSCGSVDFNGDGDIGTDADIEAFFRVLAGGSC